MNSETVTQRAEACRSDTLLAIRTSSGLISARDIRQRYAATSAYLLRDINAALDGLVAEGVIDYEQRRSNIKLYFLTSRPPRSQVRIVPSHQLPPAPQLVRALWVSMLGGGA